jgi:hypothetical protein
MSRIVVSNRSTTTCVVPEPTELMALQLESESGHVVKVVQVRPTGVVGTASAEAMRSESAAVNVTRRMVVGVAESLNTVVLEEKDSIQESRALFLLVVMEHDVIWSRRRRIE